MTVERPTLPAVSRERATLAVVNRPFSFRIEHDVEGGLTIAEMMAASGITGYMARHADCWLSDPLSDAPAVLIPRSHWHLVRPKLGIVTTLRIRPSGASGGGKKSVLSILIKVVTAIAVVVSSVLTAGFADLAWVPAAVGAFGMAASLAVQALVPPPKPSNPAGGSRDGSQYYSITGAQNQINPFGAVARIFGKVRHTPVYGALPYTEVVGSDQYLRLIFSFGYGPLEFDESSFKIGETALDQYQNVEIAIHSNYPSTGPLQIYTNDVYEDAIAIDLVNDGIHAPAVKATALLIFAGNVANADTVTVGGKTYTFQTSLTTAANSVLIGASTVETIDNLCAAINHGGGAGSVYSAATVANTAVTADAKSTTRVLCTARTAGADGNAIAVSESSTNLSWQNVILTLTGQPLNTETVTIAGKVYTFQTTLTNVDGNVQIGGTATISAANLVAAINLDDGAGTAYAAAMTANGTARAVTAGAGLQIDALTTGAPISTAETLTNGSWGSAHATGGLDAVKIKTISTAASAILDFTANLSDGDTITVGGTRFTCVLELPEKGQTYIQIAGTLNTTILNVAAKLSAFSGNTATVGTNMITLTASPGSAGNQVVAATSTHCAWRTPFMYGGYDAYQITPLTEDEKWFSHSSQLDADEISYDIVFSGGLYKLDDAGNKTPLTVNFDVRYRPVGSSDPWNYLAVQAHAGLSFTSNPVNGNTVSIALRTYTFRTTLTNVAGYVKIGATAADSLANLLAAINLGSGAGTTYAAATTAHDLVTGAIAGSVLTVTARRLGNVSGAGGNGYDVWTIGSFGKWDDTGLHGGTFAFSVTGRDSLVRKGDRFTLPDEGQYEIQIRRLTGNSTDPFVTDKSTWSVLRTIRLKSPINAEGVALVEMRIKATAQLNNVVSTFNGVATAMLPTWNGTSWSDPVATRNPAWAYLEVLRGAGNKRAVSDSRILLEDFIDWAETNDATDADGDPLFTCDGVFDYTGTVGQALSDIAATGRASPDMVDGLFTVVRDIPQTVPVQQFTPRNSWGFKGSIAYVDIPHAVRIQFKNEEKEWQDDEITVYADGYDQDTATKFEVMNEPLTTRSKQIWRSGRYNQAVVLLRPATYSISSDPEWFDVQRGDLVLLQHDAMSVGQRSARIKSIIVDGGGYGIAIQLDDLVTMLADKLYALQIRTINGFGDMAPMTVSLITMEGTSDTIEILLPIAPGSLPDVGDLVSFGEANRVTINALVKAIVPDSDMNATLTLIDAAPAVHTSDTGTIPPFDPGTTATAPLQYRRPAPPTIAAIQSDERVLAVNPDGSLQSVIVITFGGLSSGGVAAAFFAGQYRRSDTDAAWTPIAAVDVSLGSLIILPVDDGVAYDIETWSLTQSGIRSTKTAISDYVVIGKTSKPIGPVNLRLSNGSMIWDYPTPPKDAAGFMVRFNAGGGLDWDGASIQPDGTVTGTQFDVSALVGGTYALMVRAIDRSGNLSDDMASLVITAGAPITTNIIATVDLSGTGFPGTITNGSVVGGVLTADLDDAAMWPSNPLAAAWSSTPTDAAWGATAQEMTYIASFTPAAASLQSEIKIDMAISGAPWLISYSIDGGITYLPWPGQITAQNVTYYLKLITAPGGNPGAVSKLKIYYDVESEEETQYDVAISSGGTRLTLAKDYLSLTQVQVFLKYHSGDTAISARVRDYSVSLGPLIECLNGSNTLVAGHIDVTIVGPKNLNP